MRLGGLRLLGIIVLVIGILAFSTVFTVQQTEQALVLQFGDPKRVLTEPGLKFKVPFLENVVTFDRRILGYDAPVEEIIASDQKRLVVDAFARYRIVDPLLFYQTVGNESVARSRLGPILNSSLRRVFGEVPLANVMTGERAELMVKISALVNEQALAFGINVIDVRVKRADLPEANSQAIYARMRTEREREAREFRAQGAEIGQRIRSRADREKTVLIADAEKESQILRGEGDGERNRIFADAFNQDPDFFAFYRTMQAYGEALGDDRTTMILSPDSQFFRFFGDLRGRLPSGD
jgi:membrane protease subunit HflC